MQPAAIKKNAFRGLLTFHFMGLALLIGATVANLVIDHTVSQGTLQALAFGRDLSGVVVRSVVFPGFLILVVTGFAMTVLRYGRHPPLWVVIKVALNVIALVVAASFVAPALIAARHWAELSLEHGQLAPQFVQNATQANAFGAVIFSLLLLNIPVAVWKPHLPSKRRIGNSSTGSMTTVVIAASLKQDREERS